MSLLASVTLTEDEAAQHRGHYLTIMHSGPIVMGWCITCETEVGHDGSLTTSKES